LEESVKGLNAYRTRLNGNDMNLSGSVQLKSTMLEMQERHSESRGGGLNESLRRIFGLNRNRVPAAAVNKNAEAEARRREVEARRKAPAPKMQQAGGY